MGLVDSHLDVLQNIESGIVMVYKDAPILRDVNVMKALEALVAKYRAQVTGRDFQKPTTLEELEELIFENVTELLEMRRDITGAPSTGKPKSLFRRGKHEPTADEIYLACLRKIEKSVKRWNRRGGERGYLDFVKEYV